MNKYVFMLLAGLVVSLCSFAQDNPGTIIAVGDVHEYQQFVKVLETTGLIDSKQRWIGGATQAGTTG